MFGFVWKWQIVQGHLRIFSTVKACNLASFFSFEPFLSNEMSIEKQCDEHLKTLPLAFENIQVMNPSFVITKVTRLQTHLSIL